MVLVEDNGPIHTSKLSLAALAARAHWLTVEWPPKYAPELNDIEVVWHDLKAHHLAHQTFADTDPLDRAIHHAIDELNAERMMLRFPTNNRPRPFCDVPICHLQGQVYARQRSRYPATGSSLVAAGFPKVLFVKLV